MGYFVLFFFTLFSLSLQGVTSESLTKEEANVLANQFWKEYADQIRIDRKEEVDNQKITLGFYQMRYLFKVFGNEPVDGRSLYISMHGGGNCAPAVNDQQWRNQIELYQPKEGIYLAPRAPTDTWNLWHQEHIDYFFDRLITNMIIFYNVNPNKVYLMGYSAGGDGVYQLAPRMADRWASAAMSAGHPNDASPLNLRNIGFTIHVGALDSAYKRNEMAKEWEEKLDSLQKNDPEGYVHSVTLHKGLGHWMQLKDAVAVPWMAQFKRNPIPKKIIWQQDDIVQKRFYWIYLPFSDELYKGQIVEASYEGQTIAIKSESPLHMILFLRDEMMNLDQPITVTVNGKTVFQDRVERNISTIKFTIEERGDYQQIYTAQIPINTGSILH